MKKYIKHLISLLMLSHALCVGEAGAIFLLINPGAGAAGTGEAQVAKANDAYASYYNPAGLGFLKGTEFVLQHVNWLPSLADDIFYEFIGFRKHYDNLGTFGGHVIYLNLGEQTKTDEFGNDEGLFKSYMMAFNFSYGTQIRRNSSVGVNFKVYHQKLAESTVGNESGDPYSTDFAFDIGYLRKIGKNAQHQVGFSIQNIGPEIDFVDAQQADPAPTNMKAGVYVELFNNGVNKLNFLFDTNKLLVGAYPAMDWNGDGIISGPDEQPHKDEWYKGIFTAWLDDWYYGGDYDLCDGKCPQTSDDDDLTINAYGRNLRDDRIGGYKEVVMDIVNNDPLYDAINDIEEGVYMYNTPIGFTINGGVDAAYNYDFNGNGYCDAGIYQDLFDHDNDPNSPDQLVDISETCSPHLINYNVSGSDILSPQNFNSYSQWESSGWISPSSTIGVETGFTCADAQIYGTNDNGSPVGDHDNDPNTPDVALENWDPIVDACGYDYEPFDATNIADDVVYEANTNLDYQYINQTLTCIGFDFNLDGVCDCVDNDNNGFCDDFDAVPVTTTYDHDNNINTPQIPINCTDSNADGLCDLDFDGDGWNDCVDEDNNGICDDSYTVCDQQHFGNFDGDNVCDPYWMRIADNSESDQWTIPLYDANQFTGDLPGTAGTGNVNYLSSHYFDNGNIYDWFEDNARLSSFNGALQKEEGEIVYIPNYLGFCEEEFESLESSVYLLGQPNEQGISSLCYDEEGDNYFPDGYVNGLSANDDVDGDGKADDFGHVAWIDIPHDGLASWDRFDVNCNDNPSNNFYCDNLLSDSEFSTYDVSNYSTWSSSLNGEWLGITEEYKVANWEIVDPTPSFNNSGDEYLKVVDTCFNGIDQVDNSQGDCDLNNPINSDFVENDFNGDGLVDIGNPGSLDEAWLIQQGYDEQFDNNGLGVWDVDGDMAADPFAWYKDSDDVNGAGDNPNARQAHHDLRADDGQADNGGYSFKNSKYGHYNAYGNYEKGSGNDRSFSDELKEIIYNTGFEWQYSETFIMRLGFIYDIEGDIKNPTFGAGLNFDKYGFDFGYTHGDDSDSRAETMYFSISLGL